MLNKKDRNIDAYMEAYSYAEIILYFSDKYLAAKSKVAPAQINDLQDRKFMFINTIMDQIEAQALKDIDENCISVCEAGFRGTGYNKSEKAFVKPFFEKTMQNLDELRMRIFDNLIKVMTENEGE